jgi:starch-binding outer membrane protein, SusD/RagB family
MKKVIYIIIAGSISFGTPSCKKFLDRTPVNQVTEEQALTNETDLQALMNGAYSDYINKVYNGKTQWVEDLLGDQSIGTLYSGDDGEIYKRKTSIFGDYKNGLYTDIYRPAYVGNKVLANLSKAGSGKEAIEGQAYFLRAVTHFDAVRLWAQPWGFTADNSHPGIVLRLTADVTAGERSTVKAVYESIIADLKNAETLLGDAVVLGSANKWAAKALLARVYFQQNDFPNAFAYADQVIKSNKFQLDALYANRFSIGLSKEIIFGFKYVANNIDPGGELRTRYRSDVTFSPQSQFNITNAFYAAATTAGDVRGAAWYSNTLRPGFNVLTKYNKNNFDVEMIGYTEIKLIRAEAGAETGATNLPIAIADINDILTRAYGGTSKNLAVNAPAATVITTARRERELELVGEGNRVQEIKRIGARTGLNIDRRGARWNCPGFILQFPISEQAANAAFPMNQEGGCD